ncbi:MAG TPA: RNA 2',3'-cyclic phosphodiesterase, partial [Casimicrobiaceae bacterium]
LQMGELAAPIEVRERMDERASGLQLPSATADAPVVRAFFALAPGEEVRTRLAQLGRDVARKSRGRAVSPENAHLTLAFLGDVARSRVPVLEQVGDRLPRTGFVVEFDSLGAWRASGVAWIAPAQLPPALVKLHSTLADALTAAGFVLETRPFRPHVTLARRCLQPQPRAHCAPIRWEVDRLFLIGSELQPEGPVYRELANWNLTPPRGAGPGEHEPR